MSSEGRSSIPEAALSERRAKHRTVRFFGQDLSRMMVGLWAPHA